MKPDINVVYGILISWASEATPRTYSDLSDDYRRKTGEWHKPHGSWDEPLGELNNILAKSNMPAISALVILKGKNEPGGNFWGSAPNVPARPKDEIERISKWSKIVKEVCSYPWPSTVPF
jgi:hypothetical protein